MPITYVVMEIQTNSNGTVGTLINSYTNQNEAESKYHQILASASVSSLPVHSAVMVQNDGLLLKSDRYFHGEA